MDKKITRKDIKHDIREDEFRSTVMRVMDWVMDRPQMVAGGLVGILALAVVIAGTVAYMAHRKDLAYERLAEAMKVLNAPIVEASEAKPDDADSPSFADEDSKNAKAREALGEVGGIGSGFAKDLAALYLGEIALNEGDKEAGRKAWERFEGSHGGSLLAASMRLNRLRLDLQEGKGEEVAAELEQELQRTKKVLPEDVILFELGQALESLGRQDEAKEHYQRILDEFPRSGFSARARQLTTSAS